MSQWAFNQISNLAQTVVYLTLNQRITALFNLFMSVQI